MTPRSRRALARKAEQTARRERAIQEKGDRADKAAGKSKGKKSEAMQAGARAYPTSFPKQHLKKPGLEPELAVQPMYEAPQYRGSDKLRDMVARITGGDSGIGRAEQVAKLGSGTAMKRAAQPEEIAPAYVFMAAPSCSSYITGEILPII